MQLIEFRDSCIIRRKTGKDEWDNLSYEDIYSGPCLYEEGGTGYSRSIITRAPTVFLPSCDVLVMINDSIIVTTEKNRIIRGIVEIPRDIIFRMKDFECTRIEIKQAQGD